MSFVIECRDLRHSYGRREVLHGLDFDVESGRIFGLLGKNGAGKTTTINILMGFLQPGSGTCRIFGEPSYDIRPETRRRIGLLHEGHLQYDFMSIEQVERFYSRFYPGWRRDVFFGLIDKLGMPGSRKLYRMSCGQRSQVALGLILAQDPDLMILDDYSMGLDAGYRRLFLELLQENARESGKTVMITSHIVQDLERLVDDIIILDKGTVLVKSTLAEFRDGVRGYRFRLEQDARLLQRNDVITNFDVVGRTASVYTFAGEDRVREELARCGIRTGAVEPMSLTLEDAFIGITGKY